jgi:hypothetical protein
LQTPRCFPAAILILTLTMALGGLAAGDPSSGAALPDGIQTPAYTPGRVPFHPGQHLFYTVSWEQLPVAFARISLHTAPRSQRLWVGEAMVSTNRLVDVLYRMRSYLRDDFAAQTLASDDVFIRHNENGKLTEYMVNFDRGQGVVETTRRRHDQTEVKRFIASHPLGPIGGSLLALSQQFKVGGSMTLDIFAATERYVIQFKVTRREKISFGADEVDAFKVIPTVLYVSNLKNHYKVRQAVLWLSADKRHVPLRIEADTFVGRININLVEQKEPKADKDAV